MGDIGEPQREIIVAPIEEPTPLTQPAPVEQPAEEPVGVPA